MKNRICSLLLVLALVATLTGGLAVPAAAAQAPTITSNAAFVMDCATGEVLFSQNETAQLVPASTTKLLTAYLVFEAMAAGQFTEDTLVPVSDSAYEIAGDWELTNVTMRQGASYPVRDLISAMLVVSACGVCVSLAELVSGSEAAFVQRMNDKLAELGLEGSFVDSYGLSDDNRISAFALGVLSQQLIAHYPQVLDYTSQTSIQFDGQWYSCTNCLLPGCSAEYPGADGLKTGSTTAAGKCLVGTAQQNGRRIIAVLLGAPYNSVRATEMVALLDYGFAQLNASGATEPPDQTEPTNPTESTEPTTPATPNAADTDESLAARRLYALGLLRGQGTLPDGEPDLALEEHLTRAESVVLLMRLLGQEDRVFTTTATSPFDDVPGWAEPYVACAWEDGLVAGVSDTAFAPDQPCDVRSYLTLLYRALGYVEGTDFAWAEALAFVETVGLTAAQGLSDTETLTRGIAARLTYGLLSCQMADGSGSLAQVLVDQGNLDAGLAAEQGLPVSTGFVAASDAA